MFSHAGCLPSNIKGVRCSTTVSTKTTVKGELLLLITKEEIHTKTATVTMHNWRFLLLAFVAVIQPIASYTERGLVNGRQQRCDYRTASVLRDPGLHFHGTHRFSKPAVENRRLNQRADVREIRRNEVKEESFRTISSSDRRLVDTLERGDRFPQTENRLVRDGVVLRRETRGPQLGDSRKERNQEVRAERRSNIYGSNRVRLDSLSSNRLSEDETRSRFRINNRLSMELQRDTRGNRDNTQTQRAQEARLVSDRVRDDRRNANERAQRMDTKRSESRLQDNRNANHGILDQRYRKRELTSSSVLNARVYRAYNNDELRMATRATQSLDRDERRNTVYRQSVDERTQQRDIHRSRVSINRDSVSAEQRNVRQVTDRTEKTTYLQSRGTSESPRDVNRRDIGSLRRDQSFESRDEGNYGTRRTKEIRLVVNRESQNSRRDSRILERDRSAENRRDVRNTQGMERNLRSFEREAKTQREARSADRVRVSDSRREIRNIASESRTMMTDRAGINKRDVRTSVLALERSTEVRCASQRNNRDSCSINRERSTVLQLANRDGRVAMTRALPADRSAENHRNTRNSARDYGIAGLERATNNRRDSRNVERELRELERNRIAERNTRTNFREIRSIENEQAKATQGNRNTEYGTARAEHNNRRITRNIEERARSVQRVANYRRDTRENEDLRNTGLGRFSEVRHSRNTHKESRARASSFEYRRERQYRTIGEERIITHRRATRSIDTNVRSVRGEILSESRKDVRKVDRDSRIGSDRLAENRRERSSENRREIRNVEKDTRTTRSEPVRRLESRLINTARSRDSLSMERREHRMTERLNMRDTQLDRRSRSVQRESRAEMRRTLVRNNEEFERREESPARKRDFISMTRNRSMDEDQVPVINWQYIFYALQGLYICGVLTQLMNERSGVKKTRAFSWWSAPQHLIKVD